MKAKCHIRQINSETQNKKFYRSLKEARETHKYGLYVALEEPEKYKDMILLMIGDGEGGLAIHNGDVVAVHKNPDKTSEHLIDELGEAALKFGGEKLDCYGAHLANNYMQFGFLPVGKLKFDIRYADPNWDVGTLGEPDVIAMFSPKQFLRQECKVTYEELEPKLPYFEDYESLLEFRDELLNEIKQKHMTYEDSLKLVLSNQLMERKNDPTHPA